MAYNNAVDTISALLTSSGFVESKETITLDELPASISDKAFSITLDSMELGTAELHDRFFPMMRVKITAVYFVGNNSFELYENGITWNEDLISLVVNPSNYDVSVRNVTYSNSTVSQKSSEAKNYVLIENVFNVETTLLYAPEITDFIYTDSSADETILGGEYSTSSYPSTIDAGTY